MIMEHSTDGNANRPVSDSPASGKNTLRSKRFNLYILTAVLFIAAASFLMMRSEAVTGPDNVIYVTVEGGSAGTIDHPRGSSWEYAYASGDLQTAINQSAASADDGVQVWVKAGEYERSAALNLTAKAKVYGGFKGDETSIASRDIHSMMAYPMSADHATILNGNGGNFSIVKGGNDATSADTVLDGFTLTGAKGDNGGGMSNGSTSSSSSPTIANCTFYKNSGNGAGVGISNNNSSPVIKNTVFRENKSTGAYGGAIANTTSNPIITGCSFINNTAQFTGGAILNKISSRPVITNCTFAGNKTTNENGGAICNEGSSQAVITNCTFADNHANSASGYGGAIYNKGTSNTTVVNSIFWGNTSSKSGAEDIYTVTSEGASADVRYSLLKDGYTGGIGIISGDPKLISVDININSETPATSADVYMYIISGDSAARGEGLAVGETVSGDVKVPDKDQVGNPRTISENSVDNTHYVDLGAYQFSSKEADHTPSYSFPVLSITSADIKAGESVNVTVTAKPSNFVKFSVSSDIASVTSSDRTLTFTGIKRGTEKITISADYMVSTDGQYFPKAGSTFTLTVTYNVTVTSGETRTYSGTAEIDDLTLENGAALEIGASGDLTVHGAFSAASGSKILIAEGGSLSFKGDVTGTPDLYITGDFSKVKLLSEKPLNFGTIYVNGRIGYTIVWENGVGRIVSGSLSVTLPEKLTISLARDAYVTASVSPDTAGTFTWISSSTDVVTVSADNASKPNAKLTSGVSEGTAKVTVTFVTADGRGAMAICGVTVKKTTAAVSPKSIDITALPADTVVVSTDISAQPAAGASDDIAYENAPEQAQKTIDSLTIALDGTRIPAAETVAARVTAVSDLMPLPVAKVTSYDTASGKKSVILTIKASGASMPKNAATVGDLSYLKLRRDTLAYDTIDRVESDNALAATDTKSVWLIRTDDGTICKAADKLDRNMVYELNIAVKDDGIYDHNTVVEGKVVDPGFLACLKPSNGNGSGGSGGCNTGAASLALLALLPMAARRGRKQ